MRLIDADPIMQRLTYNNGTPTVDNYRDGAPVTLALREIKDLIQNAPTVSLWVKTADRLPTEADADELGRVLLMCVVDKWCNCVPVSTIDADEEWFWTPIPPLPEVLDDNS